MFGMKTFQGLAFGLLLGLGITAWAQSSIFPDVNPNHWFYPYVVEIKDWGIVSGNDDGTFAPARNINRAEFSKMLTLYDDRVDGKIEAVKATLAVADPTPVEPVTSHLPIIMQLDSTSAGAEPPTCPAGWEDLGLQTYWNLNSNNLARHCLANQACEVAYFEDRQTPLACPTDWTEAAFGQINNKNIRRVCYVCD